MNCFIDHGSKCDFAYELSSNQHNRYGVAKKLGSGTESHWD